MPFVTVFALRWIPITTLEFYGHASELVNGRFGDGPHGSARRRMKSELGLYGSCTKAVKEPPIGGCSCCFSNQRLRGDVRLWDGLRTPSIPTLQAHGLVFLPYQLLGKSSSLRSERPWSNRRPIGRGATSCSPKRRGEVAPRTSRPSPKRAVAPVTHIWRHIFQSIGPPGIPGSPPV